MCIAVVCWGCSHPPTWRTGLFPLLVRPSAVLRTKSLLCGLCHLAPTYVSTGVREDPHLLTLPSPSACLLALLPPWWCSCCSSDMPCRPPPQGLCTCRPSSLILQGSLPPSSGSLLDVPLSERLPLATTFKMAPTPLCHISLSCWIFFVTLFPCVLFMACVSPLGSPRVRASCLWFTILFPGLALHRCRVCYVQGERTHDFVASFRMREQRVSRDRSV